MLWSLSEPDRLLPSHRKAIESPNNEIWVSSITLWETIIKSQIGKLKIPKDFALSLSAQGFRTLPFEAQHCLDILNLPPHHKDPFDRALIAQARTNRLKLISVDRAVWLYADIVEILPLTNGFDQP
jgi:PIN domain nuclease of toxin-antitoxin system